MFDFIMIFMSATGLVVTVFAICGGVAFQIDKFKTACERRKARDKRLIALLESIDEKLTSKP